MAGDVLLRETVDDSVDAAGVNVFGAGLGLKDVLAEEVVLAWDDPVVLKVKNFLREMLSFTV